MTNMKKNVTNAPNHISNQDAIYLTTCLSYFSKTPQTARLPLHVSIHSSHARGRKVTWADWFMILCTADKLVTGLCHERDPMWVMTCLSYFKRESNSVNMCCNPLSVVKVDAMFPWCDFLLSFFTFTRQYCARPYMLLWTDVTLKLAPNKCNCLVFSQQEFRHIGEIFVFLLHFMLNSLNFNTVWFVTQTTSHLWSCLNWLLVTTHRQRPSVYIWHLPDWLWWVDCPPWAKTVWPLTSH